MLSAAPPLVPPYKRKGKFGKNKSASNPKQKCRNAGAGGSGGNLPPQLGGCGGAAPNFGLSMFVLFFFLFLLLLVDLGLSPKIVGQIPGVFSFGYGLAWTPGDVCPPPPTSKQFSRPWKSASNLSRITLYDGFKHTNGISLVIFVKSPDGTGLDWPKSGCFALFTSGRLTHFAILEYFYTSWHNYISANAVKHIQVNPFVPIPIYIFCMLAVNFCESVRGFQQLMHVCYIRQVFLKFLVNFFLLRCFLSFTWAPQIFANMPKKTPVSLLSFVLILIA